MLRAGKFKHRLLDDNFLKNNSSVVSEMLQPLLSAWRAGQISDYDIVTCYLLILLALRRPLDFLSGKSSIQHTLGPSSQLHSIEWFLQQFPSVFFRPELSKIASTDRHMSLTDFFIQHNFRSIPLSVNRSLYEWARGSYQLQLLTGVPSAEQVLRMQARGTRCISMLTSKEEIGRFVEEGRDVLGFIVHDLIHADHFFADPDKAQGQILFSQKIEILYRHSQVQQWMQEDPAFAKEFVYLMSDMNSVPLHLIKTLKAIFLGLYKRQKNLCLSAPLLPAQEEEFTDLFRWVLTPWSLSSENLQIFDKINSLAFNWDTDAPYIHEVLMQQKVSTSL